MAKDHKFRLYQYLKERDGLTCPLCGLSMLDDWGMLLVWKEATRMHKKLPFRRNKANISIDHKIPKSIDRPWDRGETIYTNRDNLQLTHRTCNTAKGNKYETSESAKGPQDMPVVQPTLRVYSRARLARWKERLSRVFVETGKGES